MDQTLKHFVANRKEYSSKRHAFVCIYPHALHITTVYVDKSKLCCSQAVVDLKQKPHVNPRLTTNWPKFKSILQRLMNAFTYGYEISYLRHLHRSLHPHSVTHHQTERMSINIRGIQKNIQYITRCITGWDQSNGQTITPIPSQSYSKSSSQLHIFYTIQPLVLAYSGTYRSS